MGVRAGSGADAVRSSWGELGAKEGLVVSGRRARKKGTTRWVVWAGQGDPGRVVRRGMGMGWDAWGWAGLGLRTCTCALGGCGAADGASRSDGCRVRSQEGLMASFAARKA